jgi:lysylphosphatidylglycerol synthetase-like protein (DUF2156 family)
MGLFLVVSFILCVLYGLLVPERLHGMSAFLEMMLPAFKWLTFWGFVLGLAESFLYGAYIGVVFVPIYNLMNRKWGLRKSITMVMRKVRHHRSAVVEFKIPGQRGR